MKTPCIMVMKTDSLLKRALVSLAQTGYDVDVVVSEAMGCEEFSEEIGEIQPGVVLLGESMPMAGNEALSHLFANHQKIRVIIVSEDSNWLHIIQKEDKLLTGLDDLAVAIASA